MATFRALRPRARASLPVVLLSLVAGVAADVLFHPGAGGIGIATFSVLMCACLAGGRYVRRAEALGVIAFTVLVAGVILFRSSPWVTIPALLTLGGALGAAASFGRQGSLFDLPWIEVAMRSVVAAVHALLTPFWLLRGAVERIPLPTKPRAAALGRAMVIGIPIAGTLILLFASADPVFASIVAINLDPAEITTHVLLLGAGAFAVGLLVRVAAQSRDDVSTPTVPGIMGNTEIVAILGAVAIVFAAFVGVQVATAFGVGRDSLAQQGISFADYARSGYFQLLAVVVVTTVTLTAFDALALRTDGKHSRGQRGLSLVIVGLALAVVGVALRRLALYDDAYGLTMLRLACIPAAAWMCAVLLLIAAWTAGIGRSRHWLPGAVITTFAMTVLVFGAGNPEAFVATYDIQHAASAHLDIDYLSTLSDDAVPSLVDSLPTLNGNDASRLKPLLCARDRSGSGWAQDSVASIAARNALVRLCGSASSA